MIKLRDLRPGMFFRINDESDPTNFVVHQVLEVNLQYKIVTTQFVECTKNPKVVKDKKTYTWNLNGRNQNCCRAFATAVKIHRDLVGEK